jgi:hypothetical protein
MFHVWRYVFLFKGAECLNVLERVPVKWLLILLLWIPSIQQVTTLYTEATERSPMDQCSPHFSSHAANPLYYPPAMWPFSYNLCWWQMLWTGWHRPERTKGRSFEHHCLWDFPSASSVQIEFVCFLILKCSYSICRQAAIWFTLCWIDLHDFCWKVWCTTTFTSNGFCLTFSLLHY